MGIVLVPEAKHIPRVSIGLPVFNGEKYLEDTLDSILVQTYTDFELIILDNASTDQTPRICHEYAAKDKRIRYYCNKINIGAVANFNRAFKFSSGEYFKWVAHDDLIAPEFLAKCINILDSDPSIVLCHSKTGCIDEHGKLVGTYNYKVRNDSLKPHERFGDLIVKRWQPSWVLLFGLMRVDVLRRTQLMGKYIGSDVNLLAEISLIGRIYEIPELLFFRRSHQQAYSDRASDKKFSYEEELGWWTQNYRFSSEWWRICIEYLKSVRLSPLKWSERLLCYAQIFKWFVERGWFLLTEEVGIYFLSRSRLGIKLAPFIIRLRNARGRSEIK
jgi:glycosyltransferase involved in cell wall biosynthesis